MSESPTPAGLSEAARNARELTLTRSTIDSIRAQIKRAEEDLKKLKSYQAIEVLRKDLDAEIELARSIETILREVALDVAIELKTKNPAPGVTVTKRTLFVIEDEVAALEACRESYPQLIEEKIKAPELKKIVVALGEPIAGTTLTENEYGQVKIATNLSEHYPINDDVPF